MPPNAKSRKFRSTTGRIPPRAAPTPAAIMAASEIGTSRIRSAPNTSPRPDTWAKWPPRSKMSVPSTKISSLLVISSARPAR
jgi:hypothetical protein